MWLNCSKKENYLLIFEIYNAKSIFSEINIGEDTKG